MMSYAIDPVTWLMCNLHLRNRIFLTLTNRIVDNPKQEIIIKIHPIKN